MSPADKVPDGASVGILASGMEERVALLSSVSKMYGQFVALRKVSFYLKKGHCYLLLGDNGAGKSTLLRVLAGLLTPTLGSIEVRWDPSQPAVSPGDARPGIGYMSHAAMLYDELMAAENLAYFGGLYPAGSTLSPETALTAVGLDPLIKRPVGHYSQGMRQRTSLARAILSKPHLLLLDEPLSNMDAVSAQQMLALIGHMRDEGTTVVLTTHQREVAAPIADYLITMKAGALVEFAPGQALLARTA